MRSFFSKLNARQLIIHFMASWLFIYSFDTLSSLFDYSFLYTSKVYLVSVAGEQRFNRDILIINEFGSLGLVIAYIISWQISRKRNWFWANSVIIFLIAFVLKSRNLLGWDGLKHVFLAPGQIFNEKSIACVLTNGIIMLAIGSILLFKKEIINFIDRGIKRGKKTIRVKAAKAQDIARNKKT